MMALGCGQNFYSAVDGFDFYYWKQKLSCDSIVNDVLKKSKAERLYIKFFDVDVVDGELIPLSILDVNEGLCEVSKVVPTVYITNRIFRNITEESLNDLSDKILGKIDHILEGWIRDYVIEELQIDCDWSGSTRSNYFKFLKNLKSKLKMRKWTLSATIRLHQVRYRQETGVPPVDKGVLMFYNTGEISDWEEENSIIELEDLDVYLDHPKVYDALDLDVVLPIFHWGLVYRDGELYKIINKLLVEDVVSAGGFSAITKNRFVLQANKYFFGHYLLAGDRIRLEAVDQTVLENMLAYKPSSLKNQEARFIFFAMDEAYIQNVDFEKLILRVKGQEIKHILE